MTDQPRKTLTIRFSGPHNRDVVHELEVTPEQALDLGAGKPVTHFIRGEQVLVGEDGELIERDSAVPPDYHDEPEDDPRDTGS